MVSLTVQKDLVITLKKETCLNVGLLNKLLPMQIDLYRQIFKENALDKPTQNLFNHLSYYLVCIIDIKSSSALPWPLYDTKTERGYRNELSRFVNDYGAKGLLSPVLSSYFVNPGCFKVTTLMFQMSQLAVQRVLLVKMKTTRQKDQYNTMTQNYKQSKDGFVEAIEVETEMKLKKFSNYLHKRNELQKISEMLRAQITRNEATLSSMNAQKFVDDLIDGYFETCNVDEGMKMEILNIKNFNSCSKFFDLWLSEVDERMNKLETEWTEKVLPFLKTCQQTRERTEALISRHTGEADKDSYMIEYNPNTDEINTKDLQEQVNSEQKYILKNIVKDNILNFPNLIRAFLISISFILKNTEIGDEIYKFNEYLKGGRRNYQEVVSAMRNLLKRVTSAESRLEPSQLPIDQFQTIKELVEIPPLPDLSELKANRDVHNRILFDTFTPFSISKHQFNLHRKTQAYRNNQPKSLLTAPFYQPLRDDFLKNLASFRVNSYERANTSNIHNISIIPHPASRPNETIAECSSGFTNQQICRLLSTKKSSSSKKFRYNTERPAINIKKGGLFNESNCTVESNGLYRSYSSPNLYENRDKKCPSKLTLRKLSIMQEDMLEVSGIAMLENDSNYVTPEAVKTDNVRKSHAINPPVISFTAESENKLNKILKSIETNLNNEIGGQTIITDERKSFSQVMKDDYNKIESPEMNMQPVRKSSSLEKMVNRFPDFNKEVAVDATETVLKDEKKSLESIKRDFRTKIPRMNMQPVRKSSSLEKIVTRSAEFNKDIDVNTTDTVLKYEMESSGVIKEDSKAETSKIDMQPIRKTSSIEKIINRFKKVRANVVPATNNENVDEFKTIVEEKENFNSVNVDVFSANSVLLPDLLSPSCSVLSGKPDYLDQLCIDMDEKVRKKPRESLGTALGVDHTFLDQFDLID